MKVCELIKELSGMDPEREVYLQEDPEGNGYRPLLGADENTVFFEDIVYHEKLTEDDIRQGFTEEDLAPDGAKTTPCVVLFPGGR